MPDLFDEYGALEYRPKRRPPKLLDPRKAPFWVLMAVVVAALCLGLCIRLTVSKKGENGAIARCRAALEAFQDLDSCYVLQESGTEGESTRNNRSPVEYWRSGVDWLRRGQTNGGTASGFCAKTAPLFRVSMTMKPATFSGRPPRLAVNGCCPGCPAMNGTAAASPS